MVNIFASNWQTTWFDYIALHWVKLFHFNNVNIFVLFFSIEWLWNRLGGKLNSGSGLYACWIKKGAIEWLFGGIFLYVCFIFLPFIFFFIKHKHLWLLWIDGFLYVLCIFFASSMFPIVFNLIASFGYSNNAYNFYWSNIYHHLNWNDQNIVLRAFIDCLIKMMYQQVLWISNNEASDSFSFMEREIPSQLPVHLHFICVKWI